MSKACWYSAGDSRLDILKSLWNKAASLSVWKCTYYEIYTYIKSAIIKTVNIATLSKGNNVHGLMFAVWREVCVMCLLPWRLALQKAHSLLRLFSGFLPCYHLPGFCFQSLMLPRPCQGCAASLPPQAVSLNTQTHTHTHARTHTHLNVSA